MKKLFAIAAFLAALCAPAFGFDYNVGSIPCIGCRYSPPGAPSASVPGTWVWGSTPNFIPSGQGTFNDSVTLFASNWAQSSTYYPPYGAIYDFVSSTDVEVNGITGKHCSSGRGGGGYCSTATTFVTSAMLDGVPMTSDGAGNWYFYGPLQTTVNNPDGTTTTTPGGMHVISADGTAYTTSPAGMKTAGGYFCIWGARVDGVLYNLVYNPAPTGGGGGGDD